MPRARADHPLAPALIGLVFACVVVAVQLAREGGDVSTFVRASPPWADAALVPPTLRVLGSGYDGMFYYRVALDPLTDRLTDHGITFDRPAYRQQRIVYPLLAWIASGADAGRVPAALVLINVAAMAAIGWVGGMLARASGRHALWGALFALYPGFVITLTNDLTEIVAALLLLAALALLRSERTMPAAVALALAVLARETTILAAAASAVTRFATARGRPGRWLPLALPAAVLALWQMALTARWHETTVGEGGGSFAPPLVGALAAAWLNGERLRPGDALVWSAAVAFILAMMAIGARALAPTARAHERAAWLAYAALATVLEANIWANGAVLRTLTELGMLTAVLVLTAPPRVRGTLLGIEAGLSALLVVSGAPL